jgi:hypothetical protein
VVGQGLMDVFDVMRDLRLQPGNPIPTHDRFLNLTIVRQVPAAGTRVPKGTVVTADFWGYAVLTHASA